MYVLSEETQLLGCFMVFVATMYTQAGDLIGKALDAKGESVIAEHHAQEQVNISAVQAVIAAHEKNLTLVKDMQAVFALQAELMEELEKAKLMELQHNIRNDAVKKLDYLVAKEESFRSSMQSMLVEKATASVEEAFKGNKELQDSALKMVGDIFYSDTSFPPPHPTGLLFTSPRASLLLTGHGDHCRPVEEAARRGGPSVRVVLQEAQRDARVSPQELGRHRAYPRDAGSRHRGDFGKWTALGPCTPNEACTKLKHASFLVLLNIQRSGTHGFSTVF
jgi:hypothetical protein